MKSAPGHQCLITITDRQKSVRIGKPWLERLVRRVLAAEGVEEAEIGILLVNDRRIARLHGQWFNDSTPTDVITFDLSGPTGVLQGDIAASGETARRMAREFGWTPRNELAYYVVHGLLHLTGYDDRSTADRRAMRARERAVMKAAGLPAPPRGPARNRT